MAAPLFPSKRQKRILELLEREGLVRNVELRDMLNVSAGTIRADLRELEAQGVLEIVHGGAVTKRAAADRILRIDERSRTNADQKKRIGKRAAGLVTSGMTLLVDSGTTTVELIHHLSATLDYLQVVTHGLNIAMAASRHPNIEVLMPGGVVRALSMTLVGPQVVNFMQMIRANICFLATNGFSLEDGVTTANLLEAEIKRTLVQHAEMVVLLADSSKYGVRKALSIVPARKVDMIITDKGLDDDAAARIQAEGIEVIRV